MTEPVPAAASREELERFVSEVETGGREPGALVARLLATVAIGWSLFQLWYASPLPFAFGFFILNDTEARSIHLALALFLAFMAFPAFKRSPRKYVPLTDWALALLGLFCAGYIFIFYREMSLRPGQPTGFDLLAAAVGLILLLEAARRTLGPALGILAVLAISYIFAGPYLPEMISHKGASLGRAMSQLWLTTEGVFGVALGVSTSFVFLFVLFGALLEKAGAGNYFIKLSFALLGHLRGGPAKAGVVSSGLMGMISGSSVANVVTCGTLTIPLMKRVGYSATKAGAIECAAGVNGQIMPPVMGAAAFLIAEYVGVSYAQVVKHAFLPAIITYIALFYIVDIEAVKLGIKGLPRRRSLRDFAIGGAMTASGFLVFCGAVYYGLGWMKEALGAATPFIVVAFATIIYVALIAYRARYPDLELDDPNAIVDQLPDAVIVAKTGLHFLIPIFVLVWCLMVEALSPGLSAFYGTLTLIAILVTQRPLTAYFRKEGGYVGQLQRGLWDLIDGLAMGARNMVGIGVATAAAGIIVGTFTLTGVGLVLTELVDFLSGGNLIVMLLLTAVICLVMGMGMPTTASYIIVATLMAPVIVELAAQNDLAVPLIAVHLFVFYFGLMADVTPPVALAAFAASAISGADPVATGVQAFRYEIRTGLLPFIFIFNTELLMIDIAGVGHFILVVSTSLIAMLLFVAATQNHFLLRNRWYETVALLLVCFTLFRPGFWMDMIHPPFESLPPAKLFELAAAAPEGGEIRLRASGEGAFGREVSKTMRLPLGSGSTAEERLRKSGLTLDKSGDKIVVQNVAFGSPAKRLGFDADWTIDDVQVPADRPVRHWMFVPAFLLLGLVVCLQLGRRRKPAAIAA